MASQPLAFAELLAGGILLTAALTGSSVKDVVTGKAGPFRGFSVPDIGGASVQYGGADSGDGAEVSGSSDKTWGGSKAVLDPIERIVRGLGAPITSRKRNTRNTASGGVSDHWVGKANAYALDIGANANAAGDLVAKAVFGAFNRPYRPGAWDTFNVKFNGKTYRIQIGWRTPGHFDHVHVGAELVG